MLDIKFIRENPDSVRKDLNEWEEKLRNIWTSTRRQYRARRPQIPNYDLEQRAKVYGLIEF